MKFVDDPRPMESIDLLMEILAKHIGMPEFAALLDRFVEYLYSNAERLDSGQILLQKLAAIQNPTIKSTHMTWAETLRQEGRQEGENQGILKGRQAILLRLLERKFGSLPEGTLARIQSSSAEELEEISYALLDATSIDEVFLTVVRE